MRVSGLTAAALSTGVLIASGCGGGGERLAHTCSATDRQFIKAARLNITAVGSAGRDYLAGDLRAREAIEDANRASRALQRTNPTDPSLRRTRPLMGAMFAEYGRAIGARERNGDAGRHMHRAYGLANFAHEILAQARPALAKHGCDVRGLL
ncbi:MAG: hypothetical protein M3168_02740 [Actinomycetota bacterium]|nr:hypothetical protein [Actinomycetota bacterium]